MLAIKNPFNQETIATLESSSADQILTAYKRAEAAQKNWIQTDLSHRIKIKAVHWTRLITHRCRRQHQRLRGHATGTHPLVTLNLGMSLVILSNSWH